MTTISECTLLQLICLGAQIIEFGLAKKCFDIQIFGGCQEKNKILGFWGGGDFRENFQIALDFQIFTVCLKSVLPFGNKGGGGKFNCNAKHFLLFAPVFLWAVLVFVGVAFFRDLFL